MSSANTTDPHLLTIKSLTLTSPHEPPKTPLTDPLTIDMQFVAEKDLENVMWSVKQLFVPSYLSQQYMVDITNKRHIISLYESKSPESYQSGTQHGFQQTIQMTSQMDEIPKKLIQNMGLFLIEMKKGDEVLFKLSCVTMVKKEKDGIYREVLNPVEE